jgi:CheY-like chemotaxis protein
MMPIMDGKETLEAIRQHPQGYKIPVVVLTTSDNHREIDLVWGHGVSAYILKPVTAADYASIMDSTGTLFLRHNRSVR